MNGVAVTPGVNDEFDLNGDNVIDNADRDLWLVRQRLPKTDLASPYLVGDADLDGFVEVSDFNAWNAPSSPPTCGGTKAISMETAWWTSQILTRGMPPNSSRLMVLRAFLNLHRLA